MVAIVHAPDGSRSRFMRPVTVAPLAIPVEVHARPNHERHKMAFLGAFVVRAGSRNPIISYRRRTNRGATQRRVHRGVCTPRLRKSVGPVIRSIVIAIVIELFLPGIIPPGGLIERAAMATLLAA